jgi:hypothetical protein
LLTFFVLAPQPIVWNSAFSPVPSADPAPVYAAIDGLVEWLGGAAMVGAMIAALACGIGARYLGTRRGLATATGVFALAVVVVLAGLGVLLMLFTPTPCRWAPSGCHG